MKKKKILIVPIFIPHEGCPYRCVFCNQVDITGSAYADKDNVFEALKTYLEPSIKSNRFDRREVAFYGGSFTGLDVERQEFLLSLIQPLIKQAKVDAIRVSTHPLFITEEHLKRLRKNNVEIIELGVQSTSQEVLEESGRPCSKKELTKAISLVNKFKFKIGLQLMLGLPGDNKERFAKSVADIIFMKPNFVRLYPALVLRHTALHSLYQKGLYTPWSLNRTLESLTTAVKLFKKKSIPVIRVGLQPDNSLKKNLVAGPFHPSLRYLVDCRICLDLMVEKILSLDAIPNKILFKVPKTFISIYTGNRRQNLKFLENYFQIKVVSLIGDETCDELELVA